MVGLFLIASYQRKTFMAAPTIITPTDLQAAALSASEPEKLRIAGKLKFVIADWSNVDTTQGDLIAAPGAGYRIAVYQLAISGSTAAASAFHSGASYIGRFDLFSGAVVLPFTGVPWMVCGTNEALKYTPNTGTAGFGSMRIAYAILPTA